MKNKIRVFVFLVFVFLGFYLYVLEFLKIKNQPITSWTEDIHADCGVVLTGGAGRVREGFGLLGRQHIKKLIIAGVHQDTDLQDIMPYWILLGNVSEKDVILERNSATTYGNAQQTLVLAEALTCRDILLITSASHSYRALKTFEAIFPTRMEIMTHSIANSRSENDFMDLAFESLKSMFYRLWAYQNWSA
jgi:uncharacterized SAM-binding protein YcdF (DUF218 family)